MPLALSYRDGMMFESGTDDATHALIAAEEGKTLCTGVEHVVRIRDECVWVVSYNLKSLTLHYVNLTTCNEVVRGAALAAGVSLLSDMPLIRWDSKNRELALDTAWEVKKQRIDMSIFRRIKAAHKGEQEALHWFDNHWPRLKVTAAHHRLITPSEAIRASPSERLEHIATVLTSMKVQDAHESFVVGCILLTGAIDERLVNLFVGSDALWRATDVASWSKTAKKLTSSLKMHHHYTALPLQQLFELQVLVNIGTGEVDWQAEREHRTKPNVVNIPYKAVLDSAVEIFMQGRASGYAYGEESWKEFWSRRWAATPTGSVHSQYSEDETYISKERMERSKNFTVVTMPDRPLSHWTSRKPEIVGWPSTKYEWAKQRAIYGTDLTSYELTDFCMPAVEEALSHTFPVGKKANEEYVKQRVALAGNTGVAMCFDYEDFNSQHSLASMHAVVKAYYDVFSIDMHPDQKEAMEWVLQSVLVQRVEGKDSYNSRGTLLSGWRLTTLINTVLNFVYLKEAGCTKHFLDSVHNGDDVLAYCPTVYDCAKVMSKAHAYGIRAQDAKCTIAGIEEFLRVDRAAKDKNGAQYLTRAIATAVHARAESCEPENARAQLQAQYDRIAEMEQRGMSAVSTRRLAKFARIGVERAFGVGRDILARLSDIHAVHGGFSTDTEAEVSVRVSHDSPEVEERVIEMRKKPGVWAYARYLGSVFNLSPMEEIRALEGIARATARSVTLTRSGLKLEPIADRRQGQAEQHLHKICKDDYAVQAFTGRARLAGIPIGRLSMRSVTGMAMARIKCSQDPIRTMQVIF